MLPQRLRLVTHRRKATRRSKTFSALLSGSIRLKSGRPRRIPIWTPSWSLTARTFASCFWRIFPYFRGVAGSCIPVTYCAMFHRSLLRLAFWIRRAYHAVRRFPNYAPWSRIKKASPVQFCAGDAPGHRNNLCFSMEAATAELIVEHPFLMVPVSVLLSPAVGRHRARCRSVQRVRERLP